MSTINVSLPDAMKSFVDQQVTERGFGTSSEYVRELIRKDQERRQLRRLLLQGGLSPSATESDPAYFDRLRERVTQEMGQASRVEASISRRKIALMRD
jgi:antitoxin ParD1/3/4